MVANNVYQIDLGYSLNYEHKTKVMHKIDHPKFVSTILCCKLRGYLAKI